MRQTHPPAKNRVGGPRTFSTTRARFFASQPLEPHQENPPTPTKTASGAHYYGYRYYSPALGRWLSRDPIGVKGGKNLYASYKNNAFTIIDSLGLAPCTITTETDPTSPHYGESIVINTEGTILGWVQSPTTQEVIDYGLDPLLSSDIIVNNNGYVGALDSFLHNQCDDTSIYCTYISRSVSVCADATSVGAALAGVTWPAGVIASVVSVANQIATIKLCGGFDENALTTATTAGGLIPGWVGTASSSADAIINLFGQ